MEPSRLASREMKQVWECLDADIDLLPIHSWSLLQLHIPSELGRAEEFSVLAPEL